LYPKLAGKTVWKDVFTSKGLVTRASRHWNEMAADFFGSVAEKGLEGGLDRAFEKVYPKEPDKITEPVGLKTAIMNAEPEQLRVELRNTVRVESARVIDTLETVRSTIDNPRTDFGGAILEALARRYPGKMDPSRQLVMALDLLDDGFDKLRLAYARKWYYYGNNPGSRPFAQLVLRMEKAIWALWILDQEYQVVAEPDPLVTQNYHISGKDGIGPGPELMRRLVYGVGASSLSAFEDGISHEDLPVLMKWAKAWADPTWYTDVNNLDSTPRSIGSIRDAASMGFRT
jgi:hypothetical protein